jgi:hypothetical protein
VTRERTTASTRSAVDRELLAAERAQATLAPRWRARLEQLFADGDELAPSARSQVLGVPDRRGFLRIGGLAIAGSLVLAACGDDGDAPDVARPSTSTTAPPGTTPSPETDVILANTAISLEILAIDTYQIALDTGMIESAAFADAARLFQAHHAQHRDALAAVVQAAGAEPYATANAVVKAGFVDPALYSASSEGDLVRLAYDIERSAAQTYVHAATILSTAELRQTAMTIGPVEQRHATALELLGELSNDRPAALPATNPLPSDALIVR